MSVKFLNQCFMAAAIALLFASAAAAQLPPPLNVQMIPVGQRPIGISATALNLRNPNFPTDTIVAMVANSGENSVSILVFQPGPFASLSSSSVISGIPSPFGVFCGDVVTSPQDNSVSVIDLKSRTLRGTVKVGSQPYSASCGGSTVYVSNYGDGSI